MTSSCRIPYDKLLIGILTTWGIQRKSSCTTSPAQDCTNTQQCSVKRETDEICVALIGTISPSNVELFALRLMMMHRPVSSLECAKKWEARKYPTYRQSMLL